MKKLYKELDDMFRTEEHIRVGWSGLYIIYFYRVPKSELGDSSYVDMELIKEITIRQQKERKELQKHKTQNIGVKV